MEKKVLKITDAIALSITDLLRGLNRSKPIERKFTNYFSTGGKVTLVLKIEGFERWLQIIHTDAYGIDTLDYFVYFDEVESNLAHCHNGRLYFICPESGRRVYTLYAFDGGMFMSKEAQLTRVYYPSQLMNHTDRRLHSLQFISKMALPHLKAKVRRKQYAGGLTKKQLRLLKWQNRLNTHNTTYASEVEEEREKQVTKMKRRVNFQ